MVFHSTSYVQSLDHHRNVLHQTAPALLHLTACHGFPHQLYPLPDTSASHGPTAPRRVPHTGTAPAASSRPWHRQETQCRGTVSFRGWERGLWSLQREGEQLLCPQQAAAGFKTTHLLTQYCCVPSVSCTRVKSNSQAPARMWRRSGRPFVIREVRYDASGWTLLLLGLSRGRMAALASAVLRSGRAGCSHDSFGKKSFRTFSPLHLLSHRSEKGYPGPMFLGIFNNLPHHSLCEQPWRLCLLTATGVWGINEEQGGKMHTGREEKGREAGGKMQSPGVDQEPPQGARKITGSQKDWGGILGIHSLLSLRIQSCRTPPGRE